MLKRETEQRQAIEMLCVDMQKYRDFMDACAIFMQVKEPHYYLFVKSGYTKDVLQQAAVDGVILLTVDDLFSIE